VEGRQGLNSKRKTGKPFETPSPGLIELAKILCLASTAAYSGFIVIEAAEKPLQ
jgi:hypothetical protein